jgi:hypothetical protein
MGLSVRAGEGAYALGPHDEYIDIDKPHKLDYWHYREGLHFMMRNWVSNHSPIMFISRDDILNL